MHQYLPEVCKKPEDVKNTILSLGEKGYNADVIVSLNEVSDVIEGVALACAKDHGTFTVIDMAQQEPLEDETVLGIIDSCKWNTRYARLLLGIPHNAVISANFTGTSLADEDEVHTEVMQRREKGIAFSFTHTPQEWATLRMLGFVSNFNMHKPVHNRVVLLNYYQVESPQWVIEWIASLSRLNRYCLGSIITVGNQNWEHLHYGTSTLRYKKSVEYKSEAGFIPRIESV